MADDNTEKKSSGMGGLIKAVGIVSVLVVVEMVAAAMLIPSAEDTEALARELARAAKGVETATSEDEETTMMDAAEETIEVELLTDNITRFNPESDATLNIQFSVYGVVLATESEDFTTQFTANTSRIHEQIMLTLHGADTGDLSTAGLGLIKRQILEKTNRALGRPLLREVVFTKLNFVER
ncbi:MAG: hypothetical protein AAF266_04010 [Planctomycetota bacterium]